MIAVVALIVLGPKGLPSAARAIGKVVAELRRATSELRQSIELDPELRELPKAIDEINRPFLTSNPYPRKPMPKDGPPEELLPPQNKRVTADEDSAAFDEKSGTEAEAPAKETTPSGKDSASSELDSGAAPREPSRGGETSSSREESAVESQRVAADEGGKEQHKGDV